MNMDGKLPSIALNEIADHLADVRDWCEIPDETSAGINGDIDALIALSARIAELEEELTKALNVLRTLKNFLGPEGDFSVAKSNGELLELYDQLLIGDVFERGDKLLGDIENE